MEGPKWPLFISFGPYVVVGCVGIGYVLRVELPVQMRLCPIFVRDVGSPDIHECFRGLTGSQRTPQFWGVTKFVIKTNCNQFFFYKIYIFVSMDVWARRGHFTHVRIS